MTTSPNTYRIPMGSADVGEAPPATGEPASNRWEGQLFGGLVLAAFLLYGIGSALADEPIGLALVAANSVAVAIIGVIGNRVVRLQHPRAGASYLAARIAEALLIGGGVALYSIADISGADNTGYLLGMLALGVGSLPFWLVIGQGQWLSARFARWGIAGYGALAAGAFIELTTGQEVAIFFAIPGGLFEVAVGLYLLRRGFGRSDR